MRPPSSSEASPVALPESSPKSAPRSTLISRNITIDGHRTSVRLEPAMWNALNDICRRERVTSHMVCSAIAQKKPVDSSLTAAIRVFIMSYFKAAATEEGHAKCGHGQCPVPNAVVRLVQSALDPNSVTQPLPSPYIIGKAYAPQANGAAHPQRQQRR